MLDVIRSIADQGLTMIIVTHEMSFARDVSDRVAYFAEGNILEQGTPEPTTPPACGRGCMTSVRPAMLSEFADLNLKMVGFVNNHTGDYGPQGVLDTMNAAEAHDLIACGVGRSLREARLPKFDRPRGSGRYRLDPFRGLCRERQRRRCRAAPWFQSAALGPRLRPAG